MEQLNATDAKREFGELLIKAQVEPISIRKNGKPIAVIVSDKEFQKLEAFKEQLLKLAIAEGLDDITKNKIYDYRDVFNNLQMKINDSM
ncbi:MULTISPECIES: type II toxin-antitoxin system prevent-host-death family antitoxin [unclassified Candidatus Tisiphia]|uniref:type II toxin-antitoxin system Phd/YefM family antitoxin n=1 Tax=unclassified Candidatus Tisiphia TaxID=2996318 RepID=UPI00312CBD57